MIRSRFSDRVRVTAPQGGPSRTKQEFRERANINTIMSKAMKTGRLSTDFGLPESSRKPMYGDFTNSDDFRSQQNKIVKVREIFESLPSDVRFKLRNDPANMLDLIADPEQKELCQELGLLPMESAPTSTSLDVTGRTDTDSEKKDEDEPSA